MQSLKPIAALALFLAQSCATAAGGAYSSTAPGATLYTKGVWYTTNFPVVGPTPPSSSRASNVVYSYSVSTIPAGATLTTYLCHGSTAKCVNISSTRSGSTASFFTDGVGANVPFFLYQQLNSSKAVTPVYGGLDQVIVTYQ